MEQSSAGAKTSSVLIKKFPAFYGFFPMEQSPPGAKTSSVNQEIPRILWIFPPFEWSLGHRQIPKLEDPPYRLSEMFFFFLLLSATLHICRRLLHDVAKLSMCIFANFVFQIPAVFSFFKSHIGLQC
jgi:hypothetical protein